MGKKQDREDQLVDRLQKENRELKQINRGLMKQCKKLSRGYYKYLAHEEEAQDGIVEKAVEEARKVCFLCGSDYREIIVFNRRWRKCQNPQCGKRGKVSIIGGKEK